MPHSALHQYVGSRGPMTRYNPEILRLAKATGYSADHVYQVTIGRRPPSGKCAIALAGALAKVRDESGVAARKVLLEA